MNISGVGSQSPGLTSGRFFGSTFNLPSDTTRILASQRLHPNRDQSIIIQPRVKERLIPNRKREEAIAIQNLRRRVGDDLTSLNFKTRDALFGYYQKTSQLLDYENFPRFIKRIISIGNTISNEDYMDNIIADGFVCEAWLWHNMYRQHHRSPPMKISPELCRKAQIWANHLAHTNTLQYNNDDKLIGQNIYCSVNGFSSNTTAQEVVSNWYSEYKNYSFGRNPDMLHINVNAGSFTQLVWKSTKYFGIGRAQSRSGKLLIVAYYQPAGNKCGLFQQNVYPSLHDKKNF